MRPIPVLGPENPVRHRTLNASRNDWRPDTRMVRDIRTSPLGLLAPLSQAALGALRALHEEAGYQLAEAHRARLLDLGLVERRGAGGFTVTALGRERLVSDR